MERPEVLALSGSRAVCVLGMHRSGTSALTRVLGLMGVELGRDLVPASSDNPAGFWEHRELRELHDGVLHLLSSAYDDTAPLPDGWWERAEVAPVEDRALEIVSRSFRHAPVWGFKDPRACRLLPLWKRVLPRAGATGRFALIVRHPDEIASSLARRNGFSWNKSRLLTLGHVLASERDSRGERRSVVTYDQLLDDWRSTMERFGRDLDLPWPISIHEAAGDVSHFLSANLRHERAGQLGRDGGSGGDLAEATRKVYEVLRRAAEAGAEPDAAELDEVQRWLEREWPGFEAWRDSIPPSRRVRELEEWARELAGRVERLRAENLVLSTGVRAEPDPPATEPVATPALAPAPPGPEGRPGRSEPRVCIVTSDLVGPIRNGGVGTWYTSLARTLAGSGMRVTVLYALGDYCERGSIQEWVAHYATMGVTLVPLVPAEVSIDAPRWGRLAYATFEWLRAREADFDVVHFHEWRGHGLYALQAKKQGLAFASTLLVVGTHCPTLWLRAGNCEFITERDDLDADFMERESVLLADVVVSPSRYLLGWMREHGWRLPERAEVIPYILLEARRPAGGEAKPEPVQEIVFFGRLEERKGLFVFCEAIERLGRPLRVTFLGKGSSVRGEDSVAFLRRWVARWPQPATILDGLDHQQAIEYLRAPGRLAVAPSLIDNLPFTVLECLGNGIPLLASDAGGTREMVAEADRARVLFRPNREALATRLAEVLAEGAAPASPPADVRDRWIAWHRAEAAAVAAAKPAVRPRTERPLVSICLLHRNRPAFLELALRSVEEQDYAPIEVVLVDDGSTEPDALAYLDTLEPRFAARGWQIIRQPNRFLGAARNNGAKHARGEYLLFMDDDNIAKPHEVRTFLDAAHASGADILTSFVDAFSGTGAAPADGMVDFRWLPLGGALTTSFFVNLFGDANCFLKRSTFLQLGGFTEDVGVVHEDTELFAKAVLAGYRLEVVPEALFWYRVHPGGFLRKSSDFKNRMRGIRPYLEAIPEPLRDTVLYALGLYVSESKSRVPLNELTRTECQAMVDLYWDSLSWRVTAPARRLLLLAEGKGPQERPVVHNVHEAVKVIKGIQKTASWELTGPLRAARQLSKRLFGPMTAGRRGPR